jgi:hypothetical protein
MARRRWSTRVTTPPRPNQTTMGFEIELPFQSVVDRLDDLAERFEEPDAGPWGLACFGRTDQGDAALERKVSNCWTKGKCECAHGDCAGYLGRTCPPGRGTPRRRGGALLSSLARYRKGGRQGNQRTPSAATTTFATPCARAAPTRWVPRCGGRASPTPGLPTATTWAKKGAVSWLTFVGAALELRRQLGLEFAAYEATRVGGHHIDRTDQDPDAYVEQHS